ncbi:plasmid pRiA4b ORF-3 family protein [Yinghuangia sp. ASG 101]|uniref:plasmid pRiA4b ORF-3 family protein n=1 Tax=Yinghuangia sp. ASG 101 TaxID=2896848 RepID=UPI001E653674|nr:plasmid pRiA4b ORF-3 family protein [Yinghuangia sp. ASG 101]UGQ15008.1 plasmid pRiA4b ORF-3 family protein [Yinghuangia sp. ASG 101]
MANTSSEKPTVHKVKITLLGSRPPIWRRLEVPTTYTLRELHDVIQIAFGWEDYHMWVFETGNGRWGIADRDLQIGSAASQRLGRTAPRTGDRFRYTYDFGDDWEHEAVVEAITPAEPEIAYPRCLTGRRTGPPEDCGGIWGYEYLIEVLSDPSHGEHEERLEWLGLDSADEFDPAVFDTAEVNKALSSLATVLVKT